METERQRILPSIVTFNGAKTINEVENNAACKFFKIWIGDAITSRLFTNKESKSIISSFD